MDLPIAVMPGSIQKSEQRLQNVRGSHTDLLARIKREKKERHEKEIIRYQNQRIRMDSKEKDIIAVRKEREAQKKHQSILRQQEFQNQLKRKQEERARISQDAREAYMHAKLTKPLYKVKEEQFQKEVIEKEQANIKQVIEEMRKQKQYEPGKFTEQLQNHANNYKERKSALDQKLAMKRQQSQRDSKLHAKAIQTKYKKPEKEEMETIETPRIQSVPFINEQGEGNDRKLNSDLRVPVTTIRQRIARDQKIQKDIATNDITKKYLADMRNKELALIRNSKINEYDKVVKEVFKPRPSEYKGAELQQQINRISSEVRERKPYTNYLNQVRDENESRRPKHKQKSQTRHLHNSGMSRQNQYSDMKNGSESETQRNTQPSPVHERPSFGQGSRGQRDKPDITLINSRGYVPSILMGDDMPLADGTTPRMGPTVPIDIQLSKVSEENSPETKSNMPQNLNKRISKFDLEADVGQEDQVQMFDQHMPVQNKQSSYFPAEQSLEEVQVLSQAPKQNSMGIKINQPPVQSTLDQLNALEDLDADQEDNNVLDF